MRGCLIAVATAMAVGCQAVASLADRPADLGTIAAVEGIGGVVRDERGSGVADARVRAYRPRQTLAGRQSDAQAEAVSGPDGSFRIATPPRGVLAVEAALGGRIARVAELAFDGRVRSLDLGDLVLRPPGSLAGTVSAAGGGPLLGTEIELIGTDRVAVASEAGEYRFGDVAAGAYRLRARRPRLVSTLSAAVDVPAGGVASAPPLDMQPDAPLLDRVSPPGAGPGASVSFFGRNFGSDPLMAAFGAIQVPLQRAGEGEARATVPEGARSGPVAILRDGVPSDPISFQVLASISLAPPYRAVRPGEAASFSVTAFDTEGALVKAPALSFDGGTPDRVETPASGFFRLIARSGGLRADALIAAGTQVLGTLVGDGVPPGAGDSASGRVDHPEGLAADAGGTLYIADAAVGRILARAADGSLRVAAADFAVPVAVAVGKDGALHVVEVTGSGASRLSRLGPAGAEVVATGSIAAVAAAPDAGPVWGGGGELWTAAGRMAAEGLADLRSLAFGPDGTLYAGSFRGRIWRIAGGQAVLIAGGGADPGPDVPALDASLGRITGLAPVGSTLFFVDQAANLVRKLTPDGRVVTVAGDGFHSLAALGRYNGEGLALGVSLNVPHGLCALPSGDLAIADSASHRVRVLHP